MPLAIVAVALFTLPAPARSGGPVRADAAIYLSVDEGPGSSDRGTEDSDDGEQDAPANQSPSEDDTQQEAGPKVPDFGGCIFEKRDLGLLV
jgi:hypothetical protein